MKLKKSNILIIVGLLICVSSLTLKTYSKYIEIKATKNFEEKINDKEKTNKKNSTTDFKSGDTIGILNIPSIGLKTAVIESVEKQYLNHYVCHFENSVKVGEYGNFSIAGHSNYIYNQIFDDVHKIKLNDEVRIKTLDKEFTYVVKEIFNAKPEETWVLDQDTNKKELTIVTCSDYGKERLIVKAETID